MHKAKQRYIYHLKSPSGWKQRQFQLHEQLQASEYSEDSAPQSPIFPYAMLCIASTILSIPIPFL